MRIFDKPFLLKMLDHPTGTCLHIFYLLTYAPQKVNDGFKYPYRVVISIRFVAHFALDLKCAKVLQSLFEFTKDSEHIDNLKFFYPL